MVDLVDERLAPADDVPGWPPELPERMVGLRDEHRLEAARPVTVGAEDLELVQPLHVEGERSLGAVDLPLEGVTAAEREPRRLDRPDRAAFELDGRLDRVVDLPAREEGADERRHGGDVADEEAREIDHVGSEVTERARPGRGGVEAPGVEGRVVAPVLEVAASEVADLTELTCFDHLAGEAYGGDEAVVEGAEVLDPCGGDPLPDVVALVGVAAERLLAENVLARLGGGDRGLGMKRVRAPVVEQPDRRVADDVAPVGRPPLVAVPLRRTCHRSLVPAGDRDEPRHQRRRPRHVLDLAERIRMGFAHECVPEHADPDLLDPAGCLSTRRRTDATCLVAHPFAPLLRIIRLRDTTSRPTTARRTRR